MQIKVPETETFRDFPRITTVTNTDKAMNRKEFDEKCDYHKYTGCGRENDVSAIFFESNQNGNKYCIYARTMNAGKKVLMDTLYKFIQGKIEDTIWYIQLVIAETEEQRFKVPLQASGLGRLLTQKIR